MECDKIGMARLRLQQVPHVRTCKPAIEELSWAPNQNLEVSETFSLVLAIQCFWILTPLLCNAQKVTNITTHKARMIQQCASPFHA